MKANGADLIRFWKEWPPGPGVYHDDSPFVENDTGHLCTVDEDGSAAAVLDPHQKYAFDYGVLGWQGAGPKPGDFNDDLPAVFRRWLRAQSHTSVTVLVPNEEAQAFKASCVQRGWRVT